MPEIYNVELVTHNLKTQNEKCQEKNGKNHNVCMSVTGCDNRTVKH